MKIVTKLSGILEVPVSLIAAIETMGSSQCKWIPTKGVGMLDPC
jgi:hypothetical protein